MDDVLAALTISPARTIGTGDVLGTLRPGAIGDAMRNAVRFHKKAGVYAIKREGGIRVCPQIQAIADGGMEIKAGTVFKCPKRARQIIFYRWLNNRQLCLIVTKKR